MPSVKRPHIKVQPPGPESERIVERDTRYLVTTTKTSPIAARSAKGAWVEDVDGNTLLDFTSGIGVTNTGHCHPRVVEAVQEQAERLMHFAGTDFYYDAQASLGERLDEIAPGDAPRKTFFTNSGTESNEAALKVARHATGRKRFLAFYGAFHGRSLGSLSLTASKPVHQDGFFPTTPGVHHVPFPNPYRNIWGIDGYAEPDELTNRALDFIETTLFGTNCPPEEVAACFVEPIQGEGGYVVPPDPFYPKLKKLLDEHGILLAADEVQTGFGRTGEMFALDHWDIAPDILSLAKALGSGMPIGACVVNADLDFPHKGAHSNTYGGNLVASAAALATIDVIQDEDLTGNARSVGGELRQGLEDLQGTHEAVGDVRGKGLMLATELVQDPDTREPAPEPRDAIVKEAYKRGLVLLPAGKSAIRYIPPLTLTSEEAQAGLDVLGEAFTAVLG